MYEYDDCWVHTIGDYEDTYIPWQINKIKHLQQKGRWVTGKRPQKGPGVAIYQQDSVMRIPRCGKTTVEAMEKFAIRHVSDIASLSDEDIKMLDIEIKEISVKKWCSWRALAQTALPGAYVDTTVDHTLTPNPYVSRAAADPTFAPNGWRAVIAKDLRRSRNVVCITELVEHIIKASQKVSFSRSYHHTSHHPDTLTHIR